MELSAGNKLKARVMDIKNGPISTELYLDLNGQKMDAVITTSSANNLGIKTGDEVLVFIQANSVIIGK